MPLEFAPPIAQNIQPFNVPGPQNVDPLQTIAEMGQVKAQAMQNQQLQMDLQSQQGFMRAYQDANGDIDQAIKNAPQYGVLPKDIYAAQKLALDAAQQRATLDKTKMESHDMWRDQVHAAYQPMFDAADDPNKQAQLAAQIGNSLVDQGLVTPDKLFQYKDPESARLFEAGLNTDKWITTKSEQMRAQAAQKEAETAQQRIDLEAPKIAAETTEKNLQTQQLQARLDYIKTLMDNPKNLHDLVDSYISPVKYPDLNARALAGARSAAMMKDPQKVDEAIQKYAEIASQQEKEVALATDPRVQKSKEDVARIEAQARQNIVFSGYERMQGLGVPGANSPNANLHGEDYLATLNNPALAQRLRLTARGDLDPPTGRAAMSGPGGVFMNQLAQYDPDYTQLLGIKRKKELTDFSATSAGTAGGNLIALNTMIHHADLYQDVADALKNGTFTPGNAIYNRVASIFGAAPPTRADLVAQFLAGETGKVAGEQTQGQVGEILAKLKSSGSPEQIRQAGQTLLQIAAGRLVPYKERLADAKLQNIAPPVLGAAEKAILQRRGFDPETMQPVSGGNTGGSIPPLPSTLSASDKGKVYLNRSGQQIRITDVNPTNPKLFRWEVVK